MCYALGITAVNPDETRLLMARFLSEKRDEPPDIDVDFEHERREEVLQYVYRKYGRERAALAATVICYRGKSAVRDVAKAFGLPPDQIALLANCYGWGNGETPMEQRIEEAGFDLANPLINKILLVTEHLRDHPRHLSQHVGGFVISDEPLSLLVPVENAAMADRTIIQWDKDDLETMKLLKVDCLALGMLTCIRKTLDLVRGHRGRDYSIATLPGEDLPTYKMIQRADTVGVFQIESRAQMAMLPRLKPAEFYDLVIEVAIVRPGPIQGDMVHPYLRRRQGREDVSYPSPAVEDILKPTLGVPLFQEQVMELLMHAADYTESEADNLRRSMAAWRRGGDMEQHRMRVRERMQGKGYASTFIDQIFEQIKGFGSYGFPQSHAASFAKLVYASCCSNATNRPHSPAGCSTHSRWAFIRPARSCRTRAAAAPSANVWRCCRSMWCTATGTTPWSAAGRGAALPIPANSRRSGWACGRSLDYRTWWRSASSRHVRNAPSPISAICACAPHSTKKRAWPWPKPVPYKAWWATATPRAGQWPA